MDSPASSVSPVSERKSDKKLEMDVIPGKAIGPFCIGMALNALLTHLEAQYQNIHSVKLFYSDEDPLCMDVLVQIPSVGIELRFNAESQRLHLIDVFDPTKVTLLYNSNVINESLAFSSIYHSFGMARGKYDKKRRKYLLPYPGLVFFFPVPAVHESIFAQGKTDLTVDFLFPDGSDPILSNLCLFGGSDFEAPDTPPVSEVYRRCSLSPHYGQQVQVLPGHGLRFKGMGVEVHFGDSCQTVITQLGPPSDVFYKSEDKMRIHSSRASTISCADFFYNYFSLGVDVLFDGTSLKAKKFVVHANVPGHFDFHRYDRCNFLVQLPAHTSAVRSLNRHHSSGDEAGIVSATVVNQQPSAVMNPVSQELGGAEAQMSNVDLSDEAVEDLPSVSITPLSRWDAVKDSLQSCGKPVVFNRAPSPNTTNPFGPTLFWGLSDLIFEVMANNYIVSITMFLPEDVPQ
eukprot:m.47181 g.47181  ORF g.47181 m.47181 type:complete len:458 (+) comp14839_c0_seq1:94-1467(+)